MPAASALRPGTVPGRCPLLAQGAVLATQVKGRPMASPASVTEFLDLVQKSGVADEKRVDAYMTRLRGNNTVPPEPGKLAGRMVVDGILTQFQAEHLMKGKWRRFTIGKYKILEQLGSGGMGTVYLCEHKLMRCMRAIKILPAAKAQDEAALGRFYREARAVAAIDHPNIVHAYDIDQDDALHFLVMEYVDGASLQEIVKKSGPLDVLRACHYIRQSAIGLDHAFRAGLVHRDIKPGNILVSRDGVVKILDMGLARFFNDDDDILTKKFDENVLGTADYLAPEQAIDSHEVDTRADIYSLGATFYYLLTGKTPFGEGTVAQKLLWHQSRQPKSARELRPEIPAALEAVIVKMMAKDPANRYTVPAEVAEALAPFTQKPIGQPPDDEMPRLSPAATGRSGDSYEASADSTAISKPTTPKALQGMSSSPTKHTPASPAPSSPVVRITAPPPSPTRPTVAATPRVEAKTPPGGGTKIKNGARATAPAPSPSRSTPEVVATSKSSAPTSTAEADQDFAWQKISGDTEEQASARGDTAPNPGTSLLKPVNEGEKRAIARLKGVNLLVIGLMVGAALLVVLVSAAIWAGFLIYTHYISPPSADGPVRTKLIVTKEAGSKSGTYRSILAALRVAPKNAIIEIADDTIEENLVWEFNPRFNTEVTLQAAEGTQVVWRSAHKDQPADPLLKLNGASFFKLKGKGITLDGDLGAKGKIKDLVLIMSSSQGLLIEDVQLKNYGRSGICVMNAEGSLEHPLRLHAVTALTAPADKDGSVFYLDASPNMRIKQVDYIEITEPVTTGTAAKVWRAENGVLGPNYKKLPN